MTEVVHTESMVPSANTNADLIYNASMVLPAVDTFTEQKVEAGVHEIYKSYTQAQPEALKTIEQVVQYVVSREESHSRTLVTYVTSAIKARAAVNACRWDLGGIIDFAMNNREFGDKVPDALAKALGITVADVYAYRNIHLRLTRIQAYVMGLYGFSTNTIMRVAAIENVKIREDIIEASCGSGLDLADTRAVERNRTKVLNALKTALLPLSSSIISDEDAEAGDDASEALAVVPDSVHLGIHILERLKKELRPFKEDKFTRDTDGLSAIDPATLDTGNELVQQMVLTLKNAATDVAHSLSDVEDIIKEYHMTVLSLIAAFGGGEDNDTAQDGGDTEEQ